MSTDPDRPADAAENPFAAMFETWQAHALPLNASPLNAMHARLLKEMVAYHADAMAFVMRRVQQDVETSGKIAACGSPAEAAEHVQAFFAQACQDYLDHANRLVAHTRAAVAPTGTAGSDEPPPETAPH